MERIKAIFFDWGGTLACVRQEERVFRACAAAATRALAAHGVRLPPQAEAPLQDIFTRARAQSMADPLHQELRLVSVLGEWLAALDVPAVSSQITADAEQAFWQEWTHCLELLDESDLVLQRLRQRGLKLGLVSNVSAPGEFCVIQLRRLQLLDLLDTLTFSSEVGVRKPQRLIYEDALNKMVRVCDGAVLQKSQVLFVGDSPICDIQGPAEMGMVTAMITHPAIESPWPASERDRARPTFRIEHLQELEDLI